VANFFRVADRDHIRTESDQGAIFAMQRRVDIVRFEAQYPRKARKVGPARGEWTGDVSKSKIRTEQRDNKQEHWNCAHHHRIERSEVDYVLEKSHFAIYGRYLVVD
jgi:hypothetical protein